VGLADCRGYRIFLFLTPTGRREEHMEILRDIVKFVRKGNYLRFLRNADSPAEIHDLIREMEEE
jgi:mannitol/fructose-specific phosphotransferase system IIA component (Ntr-type)